MTDPTAAPDNARLTDAGLWQEARQFATAADAFAKAFKHPAWTVLHFLLGRGIELVLKSFAVQTGASEAFLRNSLGHDLRAAMEHAEKSGLRFQLSPQQRQALELLSFWYRRKLLEYPLVQAYQVASSRGLREILHNLLSDVFELKWGTRMLATRRDIAEDAGLTIDPEANYE